MRAAIYEYLKTNCLSVKTWMQPYTPNATTPKPYGVIVMGDIIRDPFNRRASYQEVTVWPYFGGNSYVAVDKAVREIRSLLSDRTLTTKEGHRFTVEWIDVGRDFYDDDLKALTRRLEFRVPLVGAGL